jgi:hypothetical protein
MNMLLDGFIDFFIGSLPDAIGLPPLTKLTFDGNVLLSGSLPGAIGTMADLVNLEISGSPGITGRCIVLWLIPYPFLDCTIIVSCVLYL